MVEQQNYSAHPRSRGRRHECLLNGSNSTIERLQRNLRSKSSNNPMHNSFSLFVLACLCKLTAVLDNNPGACLSRSGSNRFDRFDNAHSLHNGSENDVLSIQPRSIGRAQKELRTVGVRTGVGHGQTSGPSVSELEVLIRELVSIDGLSTSSIVVGKITSLTHETGNDAVEARSLESKSFFAVRIGLVLVIIRQPIDALKILHCLRGKKNKVRN